MGVTQRIVLDVQKNPTQSFEVDRGLKNILFLMDEYKMPVCQITLPVVL